MGRWFLVNMSSTYAQFIGANEALFACMEGVSNDKYNAMSAEK